MHTKNKPCGSAAKSHDRQENTIVVIAVQTTVPASDYTCNVSAVGRSDIGLTAVKINVTFMTMFLLLYLINQRLVQGLTMFIFKFYINL